MQLVVRWAGFLFLLGFVVFPVVGQDDAKKTEEKDPLVPYGRPFYAKVIEVEEGNQLKMLIKERFLNGNKIDFRDKEVTLPIHPTSKVRLQWHPVLLGKEGNPRPLTAEEKTKFKGKDNLWGYTGGLLNLEPGRNIQVHLGKVRAEKDGVPVARMIYVAKEPGDEKVDPGLAMFAIGDAEQKTTKTGDEPKTGDDENAVKPVGQPFVAKLLKIEKNMLHLLTKQRVLRKNRVEYVDKNVTVPLAEETKIRIQWLPPALDEEGEIKKYTDEEKVELKGPDKLWGYTGEVKNLQPERMLRVYIGKRGDEDPFVRMVHVASMPGDDKIDPNNVAFTLGTEGDDPSKSLVEDSEIKVWGTTFDARVMKADPAKLTLQLRSGRNVLLWLSKNAKIRREWMPPKVLPDGKIGQYTEEEKTKAKGPDTDAWGYTGSTDNLEPGRFVKVTLGKIVGKKVNPFITDLQIAKEPGDEKVNVNFGAFAQPVPGTAPRVEGDPDPELPDNVVPYGAPLVGRIEGFDNRRGLTVNTRTRVFDGRKVDYREQRVSYRPGPKMIIRTEDLPILFDLKGRVKKFTPDELKKLQGPEHLWGFPGKSSQLSNGRTVKIYLGKKAKVGDDDKNEPFIRMIFVAKPAGQ